MPRFFAWTAAASLLLTGAATLRAAGEDAPDARAVQLADAVVKASGGEHWPSVKRLQFTFQVEQPGKAEPLVVAKHDWDVSGNKDTVQWAGKTVTVDLMAPNAEGDAKAAFQRWTNDSYWLLAPLKLRDQGVNLAYGGPQPLDGKTVETLNVSFGKVGLTSGDHYTFYIDPATSLPVAWDYMPAPGKKVHGTWTDYQETGGLKLSADHQFGDKRIRFLDVKAEQ
jgi:hypothetical protein